MAMSKLTVKTYREALTHFGTREFTLEEYDAVFFSKGYSGCPVRLDTLTYYELAVAHPHTKRHYIELRRLVGMFNKCTEEDYCPYNITLHVDDEGRVYYDKTKYTYTLVEEV